MVTVVDNGNRTDRTKATSLGIKPKKVPPKPGPLMAAIIVNGVGVSEEAIRLEAQHHPADNPGAALAEAARALVIRELLLQEATRLRIDPAPGKLDDGKLETREEASIRQLLDSEIAIPEATEEECLRRYENNRDRFVTGQIEEASHILLAARPDDSSRRNLARSVAETLIARLEADAGQFADLASGFSDCPSGKHGGNLGQLTKGSTVAEFERALTVMSDGELRKTPLETRFGFHVLRLDRRIAGRQLPFELVGGRIAAWLEEASWRRAVSQYIGILAGKAEIAGIGLGGGDTPLVQ